MNIIDSKYVPIPQFEGYFVSRDGSVYSSKTKRELRPYLSRKGYKCVDLCVCGKRFKTRVHQLVAWTFLGEQRIGSVIRHLDGNPLNNSVSNLAYGTQSDNEQDSIRHYGHHARYHKITPEQAKEIAQDRRPYKEIAKDYGLNFRYVCDIKAGIYWGRITEGIRFQRSRSLAWNKTQFSPEDTKFICDKNNSRKDIIERFGISKSVISRIRKQNRVDA